ncbi:MAG: DUF7450 family protein [Planctomycetota bacterium]|jgi:hypothetical protein
MRVPGSLVVAVLALLTGCASGGHRIDHFKVYELDGDPTVEFEVFLHGQFEKEGYYIPARLTKLVYFANPVKKVTGTEETFVKDHDAHFNWYRLAQDQREPRREVLFQNQFGEGSVVLGQPRFLLVPTQKLAPRLHGKAGLIDHYKCYPILGTPSVVLPKGRLALADEFKPSVDRSVEVLAAKYLCVPVAKKRKLSDPEPQILNPDEHLLVYWIKAKPRNGLVKSKDQFAPLGPRTLRTEDAVFLCVPTKKIAWKALPEGR